MMVVVVGENIIIDMTQRLTERRNDLETSGTKKMMTMTTVNSGGYENLQKI